MDPDSNNPKTKAGIYNALAEINREITPLNKDRVNEQDEFRFRGIDDVYNHLHPLFAKHGVVCLPLVHKVKSKPVTLESGITSIRTVVTVFYHFKASDGSSVEVRSVGEAMDRAGRSVAKALSMAQKYAIIQLFLIPTGDVADPERDSVNSSGVSAAELLRNQESARELTSGGDLPEKDARELLEKRQAAQASAEANGSDGLTMVDCRPITTAADAPSETPAEPAPKRAARARKPKPETEKPSEPAAEAAQAPETATTATAETDPAAQPEEVAAEESESAEDVPVPAAEPENYPTESQNHVCTLKVPEFNGRKYGSFSDEEIERLYNSWVKRHGVEKLKAKGEATAKEVDMIIAEFNRRNNPPA